VVGFAVGSKLWPLRGDRRLDLGQPAVYAHHQRRGGHGLCCRRRATGTHIGTLIHIGPDAAAPRIGTLNEGSLHAALKQRYARPGDQFEVGLEGMIIDLVRAGNELVEVQTGSVGAMGSKLDRLLSSYQVLVVHPIPVETILVRNGHADRRSPKKGSVLDIFAELVSIPTLIDHPNLTIDVVLTREERVKVEDPTMRRRRGGWRTVDRRLVEVIDVHRLSGADDLDEFVPTGLPEIFTTADLARCGRFRRNTAQQIAYCMKALERFELIDRSRDGYRYRWASALNADR
jgi:hypothetical protein